MKDVVVDTNHVIPASELEVAFARSSGPGGQNVNKVETKVELRWRPAASVMVWALREDVRGWLLARLASRLVADGVLVVTSSKHRTQSMNRDDAHAKLAAIVREALTRPKIRRKTKPSRGATQRRLDTKKRDSAKKRDRTRQD